MYKHGIHRFAYKKKTNYDPDKDSHYGKYNLPTNKVKTFETNLEEFEQPKESRVGKKLTSTTTKRIILMIIALLFFTPLFKHDY